MTWDCLQEFPCTVLRSKGTTTCKLDPAFGFIVNSWEVQYFSPSHCFQLYCSTLGQSTGILKPKKKACRTRWGWRREHTGEALATYRSHIWSKPMQKRRTSGWVGYWTRGHPDQLGASSQERRNGAGGSNTAMLRRWKGLWDAGQGLVLSVMGMMVIAMQGNMT